MDPPGPTRNAVCQKCPAGWYTDQVRQAICKVCEIGRWEDRQNRQRCKNCVKGKYQALTTQVSDTCKQCPSGRYGDQEALESYSQCKKCPAGSFGNVKGKARAYDISSGDGKGACQLCVAGKFSVEEGCTSSIASAIEEPEELGVVGIMRTCKYSCRPCFKGTYSNKVGQASNDTCVHCVRGKFNDLVGQTAVDSCKNCPKGRYGFSTGLKSGAYVTTSPPEEICTGCVAGKYNEFEGLKEHAACIDCPKGYWLETKNDDSTVANILQRDCKFCIKGRYGDVTGLTFSQQFKDANGNNVHTKYCKACPAGKYLTAIKSVSVEECESCEKGKFSTRTAASDASECKFFCDFHGSHFTTDSNNSTSQT